VVVRADGSNGFTYQIPAEQVRSSSAAVFQSRMEQSIEHISGPMVIDHYDTLKDASGKVTAYKVWAHR
jgi:hypothetical protein